MGSVRGACYAPVTPMHNRSSTRHTQDVRAIGAALLVALGLMLAASPVVLSTAASKHPSKPSATVSSSKAVAVSWDRFRFRHGDEVAVSWDSFRYRLEHEAEPSA